MDSNLEEIVGKNEERKEKKRKARKRRRNGRKKGKQTQESDIVLCRRM
jgi:hypothetical protein